MSRDKGWELEINAREEAKVQTGGGASPVSESKEKKDG